MSLQKTGVVFSSSQGGNPTNIILSLYFLAFSTNDCRSVLYEASPPHWAFPSTYALFVPMQNIITPSLVFGFSRAVVSLSNRNNRSLDLLPETPRLKISG